MLFRYFSNTRRPAGFVLAFLPPCVICASCSSQLTVHPRISLVNFLRQDYISSVTYYRPSHVLSRDGVARQGKKKFEKKRAINVILTERNKS